MKKILLFVYPTFAEFEITVATALLKKKYEIITAGLTKGLIISETGLQVQTHIELSEVRVDEYEGIIIRETKYILKTQIFSFQSFANFLKKKN